MQEGGPRLKSVDLDGCVFGRFSYPSNRDSGRASGPRCNGSAFLAQASLTNEMLIGEIYSFAETQHFVKHDLVVRIDGFCSPRIWTLYFEFSKTNRNQWFGVLRDYRARRAHHKTLEASFNQKASQNRCTESPSLPEPDPTGSQFPNDGSDGGWRGDNG